MPTLHWIGKDKVVNHHLDVPFRVLDLQYTYAAQGSQPIQGESDNKIIRGDNLKALKALLAILHYSQLREQSLHRIRTIVQNRVDTKVAISQLSEHMIL